MKPIKAEDVKRLREGTGMGMYEAKRELERRQMVELLDSVLWFTRIRILLRYLINRGF
jgi:hypothetical protein